MNIDVFFFKEICVKVIYKNQFEFFQNYISLDNFLCC